MPPPSGLPWGDRERRADAGARRALPPLGGCGVAAGLALAARRRGAPEASAARRARLTANPWGGGGLFFFNDAFHTPHTQHNTQPHTATQHTTHTPSPEGVQFVLCLCVCCGCVCVCVLWLCGGTQEDAIPKTDKQNVAHS